MHVTKDAISTAFVRYREKTVTETTPLFIYTQILCFETQKLLYYG